jgi:O-antigen/teichoic acid export membrane protein
VIREKKLIKNTTILTIGNIFPKLISFLLLPILTNSLTQIEFGVYDLVITGSSFIFPIASLLIEQATFRYLLESEIKQDKANYITNSLVFVILASLIITILGTILLRGLSIISYGLIISYFVLSLYNRFFLQVARGLKNLKVYSVSSIINSSITLFMVVLVVYKNNFGLLGLFLSLNLSIFFSSFFLIVRTKFFSYIRIKNVSFHVLKKLLINSIPLIPNSISWWIVAASDRWIVTAFLGLEENAIYAVSNKIPSLINLFYGNFNLAWQESATIATKDNDTTLYYSTTFNFLLNFLIGASILLISLSPYLFNVFIDSSYAKSFVHIPILFLGTLFHTLSSFYGGIYIALKKTKLLSSSSLIAAVVNIFINLLLISSIGLFAASISTLISYFILFIFRAISINNFVKIRYDMKRILLSSLIILFVILMTYLNNDIINIFNFLFSLIISYMVNQEFANLFFRKIFK